MNRKITVALGLILGMATGLAAQNEGIKALEERLVSASGYGRAGILIALSEANYQAGQLDKAADWAEEGEEFCKKIKQPALRAVALNRQGKAMLAAGKRKSAGKFEQSMAVLRDIGVPDKTLAFDNLNHLHRIAEAAGQEKEAMRLEGEIARLQGSRVVVAPPTPPEPLATRQDLRALEAEVMTANTAMAEKQLALLEQSKELQAQLSVKEAAISQMTDSQMKSAMLLMQQSSLLDSMSYRANLDSLSIVNWNLALREAESQRLFYWAAILGLLLLAAGSLYFFVRARQNGRIMQEKNTIIREEQQRSESLLLNILPALVAEELKQQGRTHARLYDDVSVLFADFVGFSSIAEMLSPQQLVTELDTCFKAFDHIIAKYNLEKIKTIGDAYMCAGGLPNGGGAQLRDMVNAARDMQGWLREWNLDRDQQGLPRFDARIGIHSGPVVAGVVGSKKFAFDIWGDTVNIAARVEQAGEGGKINISGTAYEVIKAQFNCEYRGKIAAKNKGEIDMYYVLN